MADRAAPAEDPVSAAEIEKARALRIKMPYSLHSNFEELRSFVAHLRPRAIAPIVTKGYDSRYPIDPNIHFKHLLRAPDQATGMPAVAPGSHAHSSTLTAAASVAALQHKAGLRKAIKRSGLHAGHAEQKNIAKHGSWQVFIASHSCSVLNLHCSK